MLHQQLHDEASAKIKLKIEPLFIQFMITKKCIYVDALNEQPCSPPPPKIVSVVVEFEMLDKTWAYNPLGFKHVSYWVFALESNTTAHHSDTRFSLRPAYHRRWRGPIARRNTYIKPVNLGKRDLEMPCGLGFWFYFLSCFRDTQECLIRLSN